jgi:hypothetical protein
MRARFDVDISRQFSAASRQQEKDKLATDFADSTDLIWVNENGKKI